MAYAGYNEAKKRCNRKYEDKFSPILLRLTPGEKKEIETRAKTENKSITQYIKYTIFTS